MVPQVSLIIPVHNRRSLTLRCLAVLRDQGQLGECLVVVVDDGSTDSTAEAIGQEFPTVVVLRGDGHLWWTGAIALGMEYAYRQGAEYFVWLNDDTLPYPEAIPCLVSACQANPTWISAGQCHEPGQPHRPSYGGLNQRWWGLKRLTADREQRRTCDALPGNLTCLPRRVVEDLGYPRSDLTPHYHGDVLYTTRARRRGYQLVLVGVARAVCADNPGNESWLVGRASAAQVWQGFWSPKSPFYIPGFWHFCLYLWGTWGIVVFCRPYLHWSIIALLRLALPLSLRQKLQCQIRRLQRYPLSR